tara:strand:- start:11349 stop:11489 length:141 start_codon:yes stop_codon:yes gene_type:complete
MHQCFFQVFGVKAYEAELRFKEGGFGVVAATPITRIPSYLSSFSRA